MCLPVCLERQFRWHTRRLLLHSVRACQWQHSAIDVQAAGQQFGLEALYLARAIPDACPLREKWINACVPPASAGTTLGSLLAASIHVPSPLKLNVAPAEFERIWFPSCAVEEAEGGDEAAGGDGDAVEEYRSEIWRKFMLSRDVPVLSAVLAEGALRLCTDPSAAAVTGAPSFNACGHARLPIRPQNLQCARRANICNVPSMLSCPSCGAKQQLLHGVCLSGPTRLRLPHPQATSDGSDVCARPELCGMCGPCV